MAEGYQFISQKSTVTREPAGRPVGFRREICAVRFVGSVRRRFQVRISRGPLHFKILKSAPNHITERAKKGCFAITATAKRDIAKRKDQKLKTQPRGREAPKTKNIRKN